jgi:hypothetical protein
MYLLGFYVYASQAFNDSFKCHLAERNYHPNVPEKPELLYEILPAVFNFLPE